MTREQWRKGYHNYRSFERNDELGKFKGPEIFPQVRMWFFTYPYGTTYWEKRRDIERRKEPQIKFVGLMERYGGEKLG